MSEHLRKLQFFFSFKLIYRYGGIFFMFFLLSHSTYSVLVGSPWKLRIPAVAILLLQWFSQFSRSSKRLPCCIVTTGGCLFTWVPFRERLAFSEWIQGILWMRWRDKAVTSRFLPRAIRERLVSIRKTKHSLTPMPSRQPNVVSMQQGTAWHRIHEYRCSSGGHYSDSPLPQRSAKGRIYILTLVQAGPL